jgi:hypothetical protein
MVGSFVMRSKNPAGMLVISCCATPMHRAGYDRNGCSAQRREPRCEKYEEQISSENSSRHDRQPTLHEGRERREIVALVHVREKYGVAGLDIDCERDLWWPRSEQRRRGVDDTESSSEWLEDSRATLVVGEAPAALTHAVDSGLLRNCFTTFSGCGVMPQPGSCNPATAA